MIFDYIKNLIDKPKITFFTEYEGLEDVVPVVPATKHIPNWFKKTPHADKDFNLPTIKNCPAIPDFFKNAYVLRMWCDVRFTVLLTEQDSIPFVEPNKLQKKYHCEAPDNSFKFETHGDNQFLDHLSEDQKKDAVFVWKPISPWFVKTPPGYSVLQLPMIYDYNSDFEVMPGVIDSDHHCQMNPQLIQKKLGTIFIERGTPIAMYIPFKRTKYNFECVYETPELKKHKLTNHWNTFTKFPGLKGGYKEKQKECPVHRKK